MILQILCHIVFTFVEIIAPSVHDINVKSRDGLTSLQIAVVHSHIGCRGSYTIKTFPKEGANKNVKTLSNNRQKFYVVIKCWLSKPHQKMLFHF